MKTITVTTKVQATIVKAWDYFTQPLHIEKWNQASPDWHCPKSINDGKIGGKFSHTMAAKDGSFSFDFEGVYTEVIPYKKLTYEINDGRKVIVTFLENNMETEIIETFEPEEQNTVALQEEGWKAILESFKKYIENH